MYEWQWHQLSYMQVCTLLQTDNHASTPPLSFLQAGCPSCRPTNSVKALKAIILLYHCSRPEMKVPGIFASRNESSRERTFQGVKIPENESSREQKSHEKVFRSKTAIIQTMHC